MWQQRSLRAGLLVATSAAFAVALAGCTGGPAAPDAGTGSSTDAVMSETNRKIVECMEAAGLTVIYDGQGNLMSETQTSEQTDLWLAENTRCREEVGADEPFSEGQLRQLYALEVENHECLVEEGYPSSDPPSEQAFIDAWVAGGTVAPYQAIVEVGDTAPQSWDAATSACPPPRWTFG